MKTYPQFRIGLTFLIFIGCASPSPKGIRNTANLESYDWSAYGSDGGRKFSQANQITPQNAEYLKPAWDYTVNTPMPKGSTTANIQGTPLVIRDRMFVCSARGHIVSLNAATGEKIWEYSANPAMTAANAPFNMCRGVSYWKSPTANGPCSERIFAALFDGRLIALDAFSDKAQLCTQFNKTGILNLKNKEMGEMLIPSELYYTSPPLIYSRGSTQLVVVGGSVRDDLRESPPPPSGVIRAFSAVDGRQIWAFENVLPNFNPPHVTDKEKNGRYIRGTPNMWSFMTADPSHKTIFVPLGNSSPDHFAGARRKSGLSDLASSLVAIDADTGKYKSHFKTVNDDIWDYDVPAQPVLATIPVGHENRDVVIVFSKSGMIFVLDRDTLEPVFPVEQVASPQDGAVPEEILAKTQPYPKFPPAIDVSEHMRLDPEHMEFIRKKLGAEGDKAVQFCENLMGEGHVLAAGRYQPPSLLGSIQSPGPVGGHHWGGGSFDLNQSTLVTNVQHVPVIFKLYPESSQECKDSRSSPPKNALAPMFGAKYCVEMKEVSIPGGHGISCIKPPYGEMMAYDLRAKKLLWKIPLGLTGPNAAKAGEPSLGDIPGAPNIGGSIQTQGGVIFVGATADRNIRALDAKSGQELWSFQMEAPAAATPMTYQIGGEQYVAIASGRHFRLSYALPDPAEFVPSYEEKIFVFKLK